MKLLLKNNRTLKIPAAFSWVPYSPSGFPNALNHLSYHKVASSYFSIEHENIYIMWIISYTWTFLIFFYDSHLTSVQVPSNDVRPQLPKAHGRICCCFPYPFSQTLHTQRLPSLTNVPTRLTGTHTYGFQTPGQPKPRIYNVCYKCWGFSPNSCRRRTWLEHSDQFLSTQNRTQKSSKAKELYTPSSMHITQTNPTNTDKGIKSISRVFLNLPRSPLI